MNNRVEVFCEMPNNLKGEYADFQSLNDFLNAEVYDYEDAVAIYNELLLYGETQEKNSESLRFQISQAMYNTNRGVNAVLDFLEEKYITLAQFADKKIREVCPNILMQPLEANKTYIVALMGEEVALEKVFDFSKDDEQAIFDTIQEIQIFHKNMGVSDGYVLENTL